MPKKLSLTLLFGLLLTTFQAQAQSTDSNELADNVIYVDLSAGVFMQESLNYERKLATGKVGTLYGRVGAGIGYNFFSLPNVHSGLGGLTALTLLAGKGNGHLEINAGVFVGNDKSSDDTSAAGIFAIPVFNVGYRRQKPDGGFVFRVKAGFFEAGLGFGYTF